MHKASAFHFYSQGIAAHNKAPKTNKLKVVPIEALPLLDGELTDAILETVVEGKDAFDVEYTVSVRSSPAIECDWFPHGALPITAPDVRRGERIAIYRFADSDEFFWVDEGLDKHLRRLETVIWRFSAEPKDTAGITLTAENCYYMTFSTHQKLIELTTSMANGEVTTWVIQLDTGEGNFTITNAEGDFIQINTQETTIHLQNAAGAFLKLINEDIEVFAPNNIMMQAVNLFRMVCKNMQIEAEETIDVKAGTSIAMETGAATLKANTVDVTSPNSTFSGNVAIGGNTSVGGTAQVSGSMEVAGDFSGGGVSISGGAITCTTLTASSPISAPNV